MKKILITSLLTSVICLTSGQSLYSQILLYNFNNNTNSSGSSSSTLTLINGGTYTASSGGVSGLPGDYALNLSAATGMGNAASANSPSATTGSAVSALANLTSFTVTGWIETAGTTQLTNLARIFMAGSSGVSLYGSGGNLTLSINGLSVSSTGAAYSATQQWIFFAATYNQTLNTVDFYVGNTSTSVTLVSSLSLAASTATFSALTIGNVDIASTSNRPFDGYIDDFAIYGSNSDGSGALGLSQLESVRLSAVPEPATSVLFGASIAGIIIIRRRCFCSRSCGT